MSVRCDCGSLALTGYVSGDGPKCLACAVVRTIVQWNMSMSNRLTAKMQASHQNECAHVK